MSQYLHPVSCHPRFLGNSSMSFSSTLARNGIKMALISSKSFSLACSKGVIPSGFGSFGILIISACPF